MMMTLPLFLTALWAIPRRYASTAFAPFISRPRTISLPKLFSTSSSISLDICLSRLGTLQTLFNKHGVPGSQNCQNPDDLRPVVSMQEQEIPELLSALSGGPPASLSTSSTDNEGTGANPDLANLHPYLFPIAQSTTQPDAFICAYRNPSTEESNKNFPWPIVETKLGEPGFRLLALNSEHLMRRIACESDDQVQDSGIDSELVTLYNSGLGQGKIADSALDIPYQAGSVAELGYGVDKYVLLRVGPFPDLYESMAQQHRAKGDEQSSLIAAEASNKKLAGFASTFLHYARLLASFPNRREESRDAARMCLRLPLPSIGLSFDDFKDVAVLGQIADKSDSIDVALEKLSKFYTKMREVEEEQGEENSLDSGKTLVQAAIEEASLLIDEAALTRKSWSGIRQAIGEKLRSVGRNDFASFVDYKES